jgi:hypothetical protein
MNGNTTIYFNPTLNDTTLLAATEILGLFESYGFVSESPVSPNELSDQIQNIIKKNIAGNVTHTESYGS